jgi:hypothetical protein
LGSDHYPVTTSIGVEPTTVKLRVRPRWNFNSGTWEAWKSVLPQPGTAESPNLQVSHKNFIDAIFSASSKTFRTSKENISPRFSKPWWTASCAGALQAQRVAKSVFIAQPSQVNLIDFKRSQAKLTYEIKIAKRVSWATFCSSLTEDTPVATVWQRVRRLQTPFNKKTNPFFTHNLFISEPAAKAEALASYYKEKLTSPAPNPYPRFILLPLALSLSTEAELPINSPFSVFELNSSIASLKSTRIHNKTEFITTT